MTGPTLRTDLLLAIVFTAEPAQRPRFLQLRRTSEPMRATWQPVMGHIEQGETATVACKRELGEELTLTSPKQLWQLDGVHPFFLAKPDEIYLPPAFAVRVGSGWTPTLNPEHDAWRWVDDTDAERLFVWPFQLAAIEEVRKYLLRPTPASDELSL